jgi:acyl-CoA synthetase (AMP-forming)/AMP-acid ligase II/acyl carrier protein
MYLVYGMAEACVAVCMPEVNTNPVSHKISRKNSFESSEVIYNNDEDDYIEFANVGHPVDGMEIMILDEQDIPVKENIIGNIVIKGSNVTSGYYNKSELNNELFINGYLRTGDLGFMTNTGLVITGRKKDIIFINGQNFYAHDIESIISEVEGVDANKVAVTSIYDTESGKDIMIVFLQHRKKIDNLILIKETLNNHLKNKIGYIAKHVLPVKLLPRTTSRKIQRYKLEKDFRLGVFDSILEEIKTHESPAIKQLNTTPRNIEEKKLYDIWSNILGIKEFDINTDFFLLGGDSLKLTQLSEEIYKNYKLKLTLKNFIDNNSITELNSLIQNMLLKPD